MKELIQALINQGIITATDIQRMTTLELLITIIKRVNELHGLTKEGLEAVQRLLDEGVQEEVNAKFDEWLQDGTFDTLINQSALKKVNERIDEQEQQIKSSKTTISSQFLFQECRGDTFEEINAIRGLQGGVAYNGQLYYAHINKDNTKCEIIQRNLSDLNIVKSNVIDELLGHVNDLATDGKFLYSARGNNIHKVNIDTLQYDSCITIALGNTIQGLDYYDGKFYLKSTNGTTIYVCDQDFQKTHQFELENITKAEYMQGICVSKDGIYDVRGVPGTIYHHDFDGKFLKSFEISKVADFYNTGELEFLARVNDEEFVFGGFTQASTGGVFSISTFGLVNLNTPISSLNPFINSSADGVITLYVDPENAKLNDTGTGTISNPFKHIYQAVPLLDNKRITRVRVLSGEFNNIRIQDKNFELYMNNNIIRGLHIARCKGVIYNLNGSSDKITEYGLAIYNSDITLTSKSVIECDKPVYAENSTFTLGSTSKLSSTLSDGIAYRVYLNSSRTNVNRYVNAINGSLIIGSHNHDTSEMSIDDTSSYFGGQHISPTTPIKYNEEFPLETTVPFSSIVCRVRFIERLFVLYIPINYKSSMRHTLSVGGAYKGTYYSGSISILVDEKTNDDGSTNLVLRVVDAVNYNHSTNEFKSNDDVLALTDELQPRLYSAFVR